MRCGNGGLMTDAFQYTITPFPELNTGTQDTISTGDRTSIITTTASAGLFKPSYDDPNKLIDGIRNNTIYFNSGDSTNLSISYDFGSSFTIKGFSLTGTNATNHGDVVVESSVDNSTWTDCGTVTLITNGYQTVPTPTAGQYWRIRFVADTASSSPWLYEMLFETM
jgi:hypothetical protein